MSGLTKDLWASVFTGGVTICITPPMRWRIPLGIDLRTEFSAELRDDESTTLTVEGPFISGVWAITFKDTTFTDDELQCLVVRVFARLLEKVNG